jgi:hypothetical protein
MNFREWVREDRNRNGNDAEFYNLPTMNAVDLGAFGALFREACLKCFGHAVTAPLTETEAKLFYNKVFDETGLVIGWKSLKNYSFFLFSVVPGKEENPSVATSDTLARYVAGAPYTTETERKAAAGHYPYWYSYRERWAVRKGMAGAAAAGEAEAPAGGNTGGRNRGWLVAGGAVLVLAIAGLLVMGVYRSGGLRAYREDFHVLSADSLASRGWWLVAEDTGYWERRSELPGYLTLYTLKGDNWPDPMRRPVIHNLLQRRIPCDCFTMELQLKDFVPREDWQQAGVLLSEDTGFASTSLRISIAYNDYNGVYPRSGVILLQAITCQGSGKPEEFAHVPLITADSMARHPDLAKDMAHASLRIEKRGDRFRILYADGISSNTSFKEIAVHDFALRPRYVGLFALRGYVDSSAAIPARFKSFRLDCAACQ